MLKDLSLQKKLMLSYLFLIFCTLLLTALFVLPIELRDREEDLKTEIKDTAMILSSDSSVISGLERGFLTKQELERFDNIIEDSLDGYIVIGDRNSMRLYHPDHSLIGREFSGGDQMMILAGAEPYISETKGTKEEQLRAFHAVRDEAGQILGFVMVSDSMKEIHELQRKMYLNFIGICVIIFLIGIVMAYLISEGIRRILLGNDPPTFAKMFLQREEILNHLSEGILAFDEDGRAVYGNTAGKSLCVDNLIEDGHPLYADCSECMNTDEPKSELMLELNGKICLANMVPLHRKGLFHLVMVILRDRTEIVHLTEQVSETNHVIDVLRANTHEFMNKLHVISGLIQVGETEKVIDYIGDTSFELEAGCQTVLKQIQNHAAAALILGKISHAREINIGFSLRSDSWLPAENPFLTTQELITIIGNLIENSFDAIKEKSDSRQAELYIGCNEQGLNISVDDSGCGMNEEQIQSIYRGRYTTKGPGHGYGMRLVQKIVQSHDGFLQIDSKSGLGSSISVFFTAEES